MLSRLKSTVKGVVGMVRGGSDAPTRAPLTPAAMPPTRPAPAPRPVEVAPKPAPTRVEAPAAAALPKTAETIKAAEPVVADEGVKVDAAPKKLSLAERAAAAAKAPAPVPSHAAASPASHGDDDHEDDAPAKKPAAAPVKHTAADTGSTDKAAYILRAKANGRDLSTVVGEEGLNVLADGTQFWGPVNNTSSRAKAEGKVLTIDQFECISCGTCVEQTEKVFYLPADGKATPIAQDGPMDLIEDAIEACPVTCIHWTTKEEAVERGLATGEEGEGAGA